MPIPAVCPMCGGPRRDFRVSRSTGRARCEGCGEIFEADDGEADLESEEDDPAADRLRNPAYALFAIGVLSACMTLLWFGGLAVTLLTDSPPVRADAAPAEATGQVIGYYLGTFTPPAVSLGMTILILIGAHQMRTRRSWGWAVGGTLVAMTPCLNLIFLLGLPLGVWILIVLFKPEVKAAFGRSAPGPVAARFAARGAAEGEPFGPRS